MTPQVMRYMFLLNEVASGRAAGTLVEKEEFMLADEMDDIWQALSETEQVQIERAFAAQRERLPF